MKKNIFLIFSSLVLFSLSGCISTNRLTTLNYADFLSGHQEKNPFRYTLVHENDSSTSLIVETDMNKLKYKKKDNSDQLIAKYQIGYQIYPDITSNSVSDSNSLYYEDSIYFAANHRQKHQVKMEMHSEATHFVNIRLADLQSGKKYNHFHEIDKSTRDGLNYLTKNASGNIHYTNYKQFYDKYRFSYRDNLSIKLIALNYNTQNTKLAAPPFAEQPRQDTSLQITDTLTLKQGILNTENHEGLFIIRRQGTPEGGKRFLALNNNYPKPDGNKSFIAPLRYITTNREFMKLRYAADKHMAKETFWQDATGDYDRAFERMLEYDKRVTMANSFFTSYKEGWKTDRGMIFIIFGKPGSILKYKGQEKWIYNENQSRELIFIFKKNNAESAVSDYCLERKDTYRIPWYQQVETWKN
ncbi:MAG: GWxTD domain-containing protein [Bacteroidota bacterium]